MKNLLFIIFFTVSGICASAQKVYFIYLQSDNYSPFYVKLNDKIFSSTTSGYLILPNLIDSTYRFSIGFPASQSESRFIVPLNSKDRGFLIKNFDAGLGLFDLQNLTIIQAQKDESAKGISYLRRNDEFSSLLSKAANDTSLLYAVVRVKEEPVVQNEQPNDKEAKQKTGEITIVKDTVVVNSAVDVTAAETKKQDTASIVQSNPGAKKEEALSDVKDTVASATTSQQGKEINIDTNFNVAGGASSVKTDTSAAITTDTSQAVFKRSQVKKHSESSTSEGFGLVFFDVYDEGQDTIRLLIPNPQVILKETAETDSLEQQKGFIHVEDLKKDTLQQPAIVVAVKDNSGAKSQCKAVASGSDFFKLRKNMAAKNTDDDMVAEAKKFFKNKCFTTEQLKNLSALFLTSAGKYQFFDAAYLHVSDGENFASLESEIKDDYYLKRFKALVGE